MRPSRSAVVLGCGLTAFLLVAALVTELAATAIEFSVFLGIPAGLVAAAVALLATGRTLAEDTEPLVLAGASGFATVGFAVVAGFAVRYVLSPVRSTLTPTVIGWASLGLGVLVAVAVWVRRRGQ